jgi:hypothetical protein
MHTLEQEPPQTLQLQQEEALASMMPTPLPPPPPSPLPQQPAPPLMMSHEDPQHVSMPPPSTPASVMFPQTPVQLGYPGTPAPSALGYPSTPAPPTPLHHMEEMPHLPPDQVNFVFLRFFCFISLSVTGTFDSPRTREYGWIGTSDDSSGRRYFGSRYGSSSDATSWIVRSEFAIGTVG